MNELVQQLSTKTHTIVVGGPQPTRSEFRKRVQELGYVFIKFTETRGGTDLGVRVEKDSTDFHDADFEQGTGTVHIEGTLTLNYVKVRCVADIDVATLRGTGYLVIREDVAI